MKLTMQQRIMAAIEADLDADEYDFVVDYTASNVGIMRAISDGAWTARGVRFDFQTGLCRFEAENSRKDLFKVVEYADPRSDAKLQETVEAVLTYMKTDC